MEQPRQFSSLDSTGRHVQYVQTAPPCARCRRYGTNANLVAQQVRLFFGRVTWARQQPIDGPNHEKVCVGDAPQESLFQGFHEEPNLPLEMRIDLALLPVNQPRENRYNFQVFADLGRMDH